MPTERHPRHGSMQYWPRKRAKRNYARIRSWPKMENLSFFAGYKVGMTHVLYINNRKTATTKNEEISSAVTVVECPPLKVIGIKSYNLTHSGKQTVSQIFIPNLDKELARKITLPKKKSEKELKEGESYSIIIQTQPKLAGIKKKPEIFEVPIKDLEKAKSILGKELYVNELIKPGQQFDVYGITKGKGFQGPVKRFGITLRSHKSEKAIRNPGAVGPWHPHHGNYTVAHAGQMGYHQRQEKNKLILKVGTKPEEINVNGGFVHYGFVKNPYVLFKGSLQGTPKRLLIFMPTKRPNKKIPGEAPEITYVNLASKQ